MKQQHLDKSTTMITTTPMIKKQTCATAATPQLPQQLPQQQQLRQQQPFTSQQISNNVTH